MRPCRVLAELRRLGVRIVLDDFGTGYSSLSRLKDFPLDVLKIDRSFIDRLGDDPDREPIVVAIIAMARALGLEVIAEGVETERALARLTALQCELAQGFLLSRPIPPEQMADLLRREFAGRRPRGNVVPAAPGARRLTNVARGFRGSRARIGDHGEGWQRGRQAARAA